MVEEVVAEVGGGELPVLYVLNKADRIGADEAAHLAMRIEADGHRAVVVSAVAPGGLAALCGALVESLQESRRVVDLRIPVSDGRTLATVRRLGEVLAERYDHDTAVLRVVLEAKAINQLARTTGIDLRPSHEPVPVSLP